MKPMRVPFIDLYKQHKSIESEINETIQNCLRNSAFIRSQSINDFEEEFRFLFESGNCISCANGTDALYIAMKGMGIKEGDEVITTSLSWISTSETKQGWWQVVFAI